MKITEEAEKLRSSSELDDHTVVETADSLQDALAKIPGLSEKGITVAIVDGNLQEWDETGNDGELIAQEIKTKHPHIIVIGHALKNPIQSADLNCPKIEGGSSLVTAVTEA